MRKSLRRLLFKLSDRFLSPYLFYSHSMNALRPVREFYYRAFKALKVNGISGDYAEFGVYRAGKWSIAHRVSRMVGYRCTFWGFDSFEGLPEAKGDDPEHPNWQPGKFSAGVEEFQRVCDAHGIPRADYHLVPGFYADTIESAPADMEPTQISLAFIDCDLYDSTKSVLKFLGPRLRHGMILAFDDYWIWSEDQISGERRAFLEFQMEHPQWHFEPFFPVGWHGTSFVVEDRSLLPFS